MQAIVAVVERKESSDVGFVPREKSIFLSLAGRFTIDPEMAEETAFDESMFQDWMNEKFQTLADELHDEFPELSQPEPYELVQDMRRERMIQEGYAPGDLWTITSLSVQVLQELVAATMQNLQETWGFKLCSSGQEALEIEKELKVAQQLMSFMNDLGGLFEDEDEDESEVSEDSLTEDVADWLAKQSSAGDTGASLDD